MIRYLSQRLRLGVLLVGIILPSSAYAQEQKTQPAAVGIDQVSSVFAFNRTCYAQVPNVDAIKDMAVDLVWQGMEAADLKAFETGGKLDVLEGWDAQIGERIYRVGLTQGPLLENQAETFPEFANGKTTTCTFTLDGLDAPGVVAGEMQALAGKEPISKDVEKDGLFTTTWAGGNNDIKVFLISSLGGEKGGFLSVTVLTK